MECNDISCQFCTSEDVYYTELKCNLMQCSRKGTENCPLQKKDLPETEDFPETCFVSDAYTRNVCSVSRCMYDD